MDRPPKEKHDVEDIAAKLLWCSIGTYRILKSTGRRVTNEHDGLQDMVSADLVSLAPRPLTANHPQDISPLPAPNTAPPPRSLETPAPWRPAPPSPMLGTPPNTMQELRDPIASSGPPSHTVSADPHGLPVFADDGYYAYLPEGDDKWNTLAASHRDDGYEPYIPEHNDHREHVVDHIICAGLGENNGVLYKVR